MLVYFADLAHDHFKVNQYTPTGIGYLTAYSKFKLGNHVEFRLFKSVNKLLDTYEKEKPDLVGLSNYTWNTGLSKFAGSFIKKRDPSLPQAATAKFTFFESSIICRSLSLPIGFFTFLSLVGIVAL